MSWGVQAIGKPEAVRAKLVADFVGVLENLKNIPEEQACASAIEDAIGHTLNFLKGVPGIAVKVAASGSVYRSGDSASASATLSFETLYNFVE